MRAGIVILPEFSWQPGGSARDKWQRAEQYGFDHAWTYDHLGWRNLVDSAWYDAVPTLSAAAMVTSQIRLGTLVASPNFRHPAHFAREITALDDLSEGRLSLGLGAGAASFDARVLGHPELSARQRVDRFAEFVTGLDLVLTQDRTDFSGEYYSAVDARGTPGCVQKPRAPFVMAANGMRSMRLAAEFGQAWVTTGVPSDDLSSWWSAVRELTERMDTVLAEANRDRSTFDRYLSLDAAPVYSLSSVDAFTDAVGRAADLGFTDVVTHWPRKEGWYAGKEATLETVAADVLPALKSPDAPWPALSQQ